MKTESIAIKVILKIFVLLMASLITTTTMITAQEHRGNEAGGSHEDEHEKRIVVLSQNEISEFGIKLAQAGPGKLNNYAVVPGEVVVNGDRVAHIHPRFSGVVKEVRKRIGEMVTQGEILAIVESNEALKPYEVISHMDGVVIEKHIAVGEISSDDVSAFVIADLDTVWINLSLFQLHLPLVRVGQKVVVRADVGTASKAGEISYISPIVDEHTRTATARVVLDNMTGEWRPGLFVEGRIEVGTISVPLAVPKTALFKLGGIDVVFVQTQEGFESHPVEIGRTDEKSAEILSGLGVGMTYVSSGGFTIKAEFEKNAFGDEHGH